MKHDSASLIGGSLQALTVPNTSDGSVPKIGELALRKGAMLIGLGTGEWGVAAQINNPPVADFSYVVASLQVTFTNESTDADNDIVSRLWDFGDGTSSTSSNQTLIHEYVNSGTYTVSLTVTDRYGATSTQTKTFVAEDASMSPQTYTKTANQAINDNASISSTITIPTSRRGTSASQLNVKVSLTHTAHSDLTITLTRGGKSFTLWNKQSAVRGSKTHDLYFPTAGVTVAGNWTLSIRDNNTLDTGTLFNWSLTI